MKPKVTQGMNDWLVHPFVESKVKGVLKQMYSLKAPGLDGIPPLFF